MPTISPQLLPVLMLFASNVFMTFAWYGHLKFKESPLPLVIMVSWGIAFFEYWLAVPANRWGSAVYSAAQLKTMQEVITLVVFAGFSVLYLKEPLGWNHGLGFALIAAGAFFIFHKWSTVSGPCAARAFTSNPRRAAEQVLRFDFFATLARNRRGSYVSGRRPHFAGDTRSTRPAELSVSSHSAPSGPWRTSRIRSLRFCSSRSSPVMVLPSSESRTSILPASAPVNRLPLHFGNSFAV